MVEEQFCLIIKISYFNNFPEIWLSWCNIWLKNWPKHLVQTMVNIRGDYSDTLEPK